MTCPRCNKTEPYEYCWEARADCPHPPRNLTTQELWPRLQALEERVKHLEPHYWIGSEPPMCFCQETFATEKELYHHVNEYSSRDD